jgi:hypothetical protein
MTDPVERAAAAAADEVLKSESQVDGREELAQRVREAVEREMRRPVTIGRSDDPLSAVDEQVITYLVDLAEADFTASGRSSTWCSPSGRSP